MSIQAKKYIKKEKRTTFYAIQLEDIELPTEREKLEVSFTAIPKEM